VSVHFGSRRVLYVGVGCDRLGVSGFERVDVVEVRTRRDRHLRVVRPDLKLDRLGVVDERRRVEELLGLDGERDGFGVGVILDRDRGVEADHVRVRDRFDTQPVLGEPERHCVREVRQQARDGEEVGGLDVGVETREALELRRRASGAHAVASGVSSSNRSTSTPYRRTSISRPTVFRVATYAS